MNTLSLTITAVLLAAATAQPTLGQDAMATDAMAPDAMAGEAMMSDADLALCLEQAGMITFASVMQVAQDACHAGHGSAMAGDAMAPAQ